MRSTDKADPTPVRKNAQDRAAVLLLVGTSLLLPPLIGLVDNSGRIAGLPIPLIYVFSVWAVLIGGAAAVAGPLHRSGKASKSETPSDTAD